MDNIGKTRAQLAQELAEAQNYIEELEALKTENDQARQGRMQSEERFRLAFQTSPDSININRLEDGLYVDINEGFTTITGYSRGDVIGETSLELNIWNNPSDRAKLTARLRENGYCDNLEAEFVSKSGEIIIGLMSARIITLNDVPHIISITRDITKRKQMEEELREREAKFRILFERSLDAIFWVDRKTGRYLDANAAAEQLTGRTINELRKLTTHDVSPQQAAERLQQLPGIDSDIEFNEVLYVRPDNTTRTALLAVVRASEDIVFGIAHDITQRKQLEAESRSAEILRVELAKEKEIVALKERFVSIVSHEFRTPLAIIQTSSDLFMNYSDRMTGERQQQLFQQISSQVMSMKDLMDQTLAVSRGQAGKTDFAPVLLDIEPFCLNIFEQIQFTDTLDHQFEFICNAPDNPLTADGNLLQHILTNLLTNAVKFSPEKSKICFVIDYDDDFVYFTISDEGIGIPEDDLSHVFEPFHRAGNVGKIQGTGLGLSIARQYTELHGGLIFVQSELGKGTSFIVSFPR
jgi:PAS domain S-box-containing protein